MDICGHMWIYVDIILCGYNYVDICGYILYGYVWINMLICMC